jgi:hypothetical protein
MYCRTLLRTCTVISAAASFAFVHAAALESQSAGSRAPVSTAAPAPPVVEIIAEDYALSAPDEIPAGWTTFRFRNEGQEPHFVLVSRLPDGITIEDYETDLSAEFVRAWYAVRDGELGEDEAMARLFGALPEWFPGLEFLGGPGLTAPELTTETTLNLEPGNYVLECYMKTEDGEFHYTEGMIRPIRITETRSGAGPPTPDIRITLSNFEMEIDGDLTPGRHVVEVHIAENPDEGFGHNVHVARQEPDTEVNEVIRWMNAFDLNGLTAPGPARFVGGAQIMPAGHTAYFTLDLERGQYLLISEYTGHMGVLQEVTVTP